MIAHLHHTNEIKIGSTLSQVALSIRLGRASEWVRRQGVTVQALGETWNANYYNGGRIHFYKLAASDRIA